MSKLKISVLIPAFNEVQAIRHTVENLRQALATQPVEAEILVIDDGSTDGTDEQARLAGVTVLRHPHNIGYGRALKTGLERAAGDWVVIVDADGTYPTEALPALLREIPAFDMVVGARGGPCYHGSLAKRLGRWTLKAMVQFVCGISVPDVNSGFRVFRRDIALRHLPNISNGFSFTTTLTLIMLLEGHFVHYVPIDYRERAGKSKVRFRRDILRTMQILVQAILQYNPIKLFLLFATAPAWIAPPALLLDFFLAQGAHSGIIVALLGSASLLIFGLGLVRSGLK